LKTNKWREEMDVANLADSPAVAKHANKARVLKHRDCVGRPVIVIPVKNHNSSDRDIDELTKFIIYCLEEACKRCFEEITDTLCIVFDMTDFSTSCMDYQLIKNLIWLLSKHYPERLGISFTFDKTVELILIDFFNFRSLLNNKLTNNVLHHLASHKSLDR
jgi:hypothetical protein